MGKFENILCVRNFYQLWFTCENAFANILEIAFQ